MTSRLLSLMNGNKLISLVESKGFKLARNPHFILKSEYEPLIRYLKTSKGYMLSLLQEQHPIRTSSLIQTEELLIIKNESCAIPLE